MIDISNLNGERCEDMVSLTNCVIGGDGNSRIVGGSQTLQPGRDSRVQHLSTTNLTHLAQVVSAQIKRPKKQSVIGSVFG